MKIFNNKIKFGLSAIAILLALTFTSCESELDKEPITELTESQVFDDPASYKEFLARIYAGFAISGQQGPAGRPDIQGIDEGFSNYMRQYFKHQELTTDEAIIAWRDGTIHDLHNHVWTPSNEFVRAMYDRIYYQIGVANQFLRETTDAKLDGRGVDSDLKAEIEIFKAEVRFLRALSYWHAIDFYGNVPFVTEENKVGKELPVQKSREEVFNFIEEELLAIESILPSRTGEYGRADQGAVFMLLAKLYLNAEVYTGNARYNEAMTYTGKVISNGYNLHESGKYHELFLADNDSNGAQNEIIFPIMVDGLSTTGYGGTTFLTHASVGGSMEPSEFGINGGWWGLRTTKNYVELFDIDFEALNSKLGSVSDWGLVGSATVYGWGEPDVKMYEIGTDKYAVYANLTSGQIKFRFNEDWGLNYGDTGVDGTLDDGGENINVEEGVYYIVMDLNDLTYSISKYEGDPRAQLYTDGQTLDIEDPFNFNHGFAIAKYRNVTSLNDAGRDDTGEFVDIDFPMFRLADAYLMYGEIFLRGGGGDASTAVEYINMLRERAFTNSNFNITEADLDLGFILDERSRELHWEGHRRTDLIRFGQFSDQGVWPWKGGVKEGVTTESFRDIYPIPSTDIIANPNLVQNPGY